MQLTRTEFQDLIERINDMKDFLNWLIPIAFCISGIYYFWKSSNAEAEDTTASDSDVSPNEDNMATEVQSVSMKLLLEQTLKNIGCHINMCEEKEGEFHITYQGEHFTIIYSEDSPFITIYDVAWYSAELIDIDNLSLVRQAVNACNQQNLATVLYTIDKNENCVNVHTRQCTIFGSYIPEVETYLRSQLEDSFRQHHNFYRHIEAIRKEQYA